MHRQSSKGTQLADVPEYSTAYLDDVAIFSQTWTENLRHIRKFLEKISTCGLTLKMGVQRN